MIYKKLFFIFVPLLLIMAICLALYRGLSLESAVVPSKLIGKPVPNIILSDLYHWNKMIEFNKLPPKDSVIGHWYLINLWASWCEPCQNEHPFLMDLARQGVVIYGFNYQDKAAAAKKWLADYGSPYTMVLWDAVGRGGARLGLYTIPETFLVDPHGIIRYRLIGELTPRNWKNNFIPVIIEQNEKDKMKTN